MDNIAPAWIEEGNVWSVSGTSITCTGSLTSSGYLYMVVLDEGAPEPNAQQVVWGVDGHNNPSRNVSAYYDKNSAAGYVTYTGLTAETKYDIYIAATNDYPGNNRAVVSGSFGYPGVRTDIVCSSNCDLYIVADEDDNSLWLTITALVILLF